MAKIDCSEDLQHGWKISINGLPFLKNCHFKVPNDPSSAAFPIVAALLIPNSKIIIRNICVNKLRIGLIETLIEMGGKITVFNKRIVCGEEIADIEAVSSNLKGVNVPEKRAPTMIDEYPILSIAACFAEGETVMNGIKELRNKETDRIKETVNNLKKLGFEVKSTENKMIIHGMKRRFIKGDIEVDSKLDHRIAMSFLCLGLLSKEPIIVKNVETINSSFPNFYKSMKNIGAEFDYL